MLIHRGEEPPAFVLIPGFLGFDELRLGPLRVAYFRDIAAAFAGAAHALLVVPIPPLGTVAERAEVVAAEIEHCGLRGPVVLIGHSMGGLDARYVASRLDPSGRVAAVVTVGTPHRGTALADWALGTEGVAQRLARRMAGRAIGELTVGACLARNAEITDRPDLPYFSYAGARPPPELPWVLRACGRFLTARSGANDGLVAVTSARWGELRECVRADHLELVGWSLRRRDGRAQRPHDHLAFFRRIAAECRSRVAAARPSRRRVR